MDTKPINTVPNNLWRHSQQTMPSGTPQHPSLHQPPSGDAQLSNSEHQQFCNYLYNVFRAQVANDPSTVVLSNTRVDWGTAGIAPHTPNLAVIPNIRRPAVWSTFETLSEGTKPILIVEVTSPDYREVAIVDKFEEYAQVGLQSYVIADSYNSQGKINRRVLAYELGDRGYEAVPSENQRVWLRAVGLWLGFEGNQLVCYNAKGQPFLDYIQLVKALSEAESQLQAEREARLALESRLSLGH